MMCSTWKISVFGIVALMLAFGLATTDALAVKTGVDITVAGIDDGTVRAASELTINFSVAFDGTASTDGDDVPGDVTIFIPSVWSRPIIADDETTDAIVTNPPEVGEVVIGGEIDGDSDGALDAGDLFGLVSSPNIIARAGKDLVSQTITFAFRTKAPVRQGVYTITVSAPKFTLAAGDDKIRVVVGPVAAGAGSGGVVMTRSPTPLPAQPDTDDNLSYENMFVVNSKESLNNLIFTFTPKGTISGGSTVVLTLNANWPDFTHASDDTEVGVSGRAASRLDITRAADSVTATVKADALLQMGDTVVFTIKKADFNAPEVTDTTGAIITGWDFTVTSTIAAEQITSNLLDTPVDFTESSSANVRDPFNIVTTKPHGTGKLNLHSGTTGTEAFSYHTAGGDIPDDTLRFTWSGLIGIADGSKFEITIPEPWPQPFVPIGTGVTANGALTAAPAVTVEGRTIKGTFDTTTLTSPTGPTITYFVDKAPASQEIFSFPAKASAGHHGDPMPLADGNIPKLELTVGPGKGSVALVKGGQALTQTTSEAPLGTLSFVFTPGGRMAAGSKVEIDRAEGWTLFREDSGPRQNPDGEIVLTSTKGNIVVTADRITFVSTEVLTAADSISITYRGVKVPKVDGSASHTFHSRANSYPGENTEADGTLGDGTDISDPTIGIGRAPDGGGTIALSVKEADAGSVIAELQIVYTAAGKMEIGSVVEVSLPANGDWDAPSNVTGEKGYTVLGDRSADLSLGDTTMTATTAVVLESGDQLIFKYQNVTAPTIGGTYTFTAKSSSAPDSEPVGLTAGGDTITIKQVAAGTMMLSDASGELTSAVPGAELGNLTFLFTAGARMEIGSEVTLEIPGGWTRANYDIDGVEDPGDVTLAGSADLDISTGANGARIVKATANAVLEPTDTLTFTYAMVTAPSAEGSYPFTTMVSVVSGGAPLPVDSPPNVTVRLPITALAIATDPDPATIFVDESITVTVTLWDDGDGTDSEGQTIDPIVITLDDGKAGGTFDPASITIPADGHSGSATYNNTGQADTMITASAMGLDDVSVAVSVKSGITAKSVDPDPASAGMMVTVSATGDEDGPATLTFSYVNADDNTVNVEKGMDPVGDPVDGSQKFSREITLPADLPEGAVMVSLTIAGRSDSVSFEVINDQDPPTVSNVESSEDVVVNGDSFTLSANVALNDSMVALAEGGVTAMLGGLDSNQTEAIPMQELEASPGTWFTIVTITADDADVPNTAEDGEYTITVTAMDRIGNMHSDSTMVTLENDPSELTSVMVEPSTAKAGVEIWVKAEGSEGATPTAVIENTESGVIAQLTLVEDAEMAGSYSAGLMLNEAHTAGEYTVTVTLGTKMDTAMLTIEPPGYEFTLDIPMGRSMIHIPLDVEQVDGVDMEINTVRDLFNALGDAVNYITTTGDGVKFDSYLGDDAPGMAFGDMMIADDTGLIVSMSAPKSLALKGEALGMNGSAALNLRKGVNLVGVPLDTGVLSMISDAIDNLLFPGITSILIMEGGEFKTVVAGTDTDGPVMGGRGYIVITSDAVMLQVPGTAWQNDGGGTSSTAPVALSPTSTSVLHVRGQLVDEAGMMALDGLNVSVKNLTSGLVLGSTFATDAYDMTFVKFDATAAKVGDRLEISADSANPLLGIRSVQHVVTAEDVLDGSISLPDLVTYEIPAQTELLSNYPNPFNPETWIPFRLAKDSNVSLSIYGTHGRLVRSIDVGFTPAAVYEGRSDAIYWDGRNNFGEQVSSGLYFYHLQAGEFSATRRMVIVK
ncbi:MAG: hypothetical protein OXN17_14480 [Candidatus Poribacteria bacterium]|nr:hypothetical protein [Candidatus Poribacteria bacterium]